MAKKTKNLQRDGMGIVTKAFFTLIFFMMGFSIVGAGLAGRPATAPIVMTIGMLMVVIGLAPYIVPPLYRLTVPQDEANNPEAFA